MKLAKKKWIVECLFCGENIYVSQNFRIGSFVACRHCDSQFEITDLVPPMIDWPEYDREFEGDLEDEYSYL